MGYRPRENEPSLVAVAAVVVFGTVAQSSSTQLNQMGSDMVCWTLLPFLFAISSARSSSSSSHDTSSTRKLPNPSVFTPSSKRSSSKASSPALWIVASCIALNCLYQSEMGRIDLFTRDNNKATSILSVKSIPAFLASTSWGTCLVALFAVAAWTRWGPLRYTASLVPMAALMVLFITLRSKSRRDSQFIKPFDFRDAVVPLAGRTLGLLVPIIVLEVFLLDYPLGGLMGTLITGVSKAFWWYFMAQVSETSSWRVATTSTTFSIMATLSPFTQSSAVRALSHVIVAIISLGQIIEIALPPRDKPKLLLWAFCLIPIIPYLSNMITIHYLRPSAVVSANHPVIQLVQQAQAGFDAMLQRQSKTYPEARDEYLRRYGVNPPPGFEAWFNYAKSVNSPIIDDYDTIYDSISPFWVLSGAQVHDAMRRIAAQPGSDVWSCTLTPSYPDSSSSSSPGTGTRTRCTHPYRSFDRHNSDMFNSLLGDISLPPGTAPVKFLINHLDEPRVLFPPEGDSRIDPTSGKVIINPIYQPHLSSPKQDIFPLLTSSCPVVPPPHDPSSTSPSSLFPPLESHHPNSLCHSPPSIQSQHGLFLSPTNFPLIHSFVPILSTGSPTTMSDILYPAPAYSETRFLYDPNQDPGTPWSEKKSKLYWVGESTGGLPSSSSSSSSDSDSSGGNWRNFHRQRFVSLASGLGLGLGLEGEENEIKYLSESSLSSSPSSQLTLTTSTALNPLNYEVSFSHIISPSSSSSFLQNRFPTLAQKSFFSGAALRPRPAPPTESSNYKLAFDLDGNGISGRFYRLLSSSSTAVLKQTIFREWHDDRLKPWVHFFPVSVGMGELPDMVRFLLETEKGEGDEIAKGVAGRGSKWMTDGGMSEVDRGVYLFRLVLELSRLGDPLRGGWRKVMVGEDKNGEDEEEEGRERWEEV